jgi:hypothetical protein
MEEKRRWSLLVLVGTGLVVAALAYLGSGPWATAGPNSQQTVPAPATKNVDKTLVLPTHDAVFDLSVGVPSQSLPWDNVVLTDTIDSYLAIGGVTTSQGSINVLGQAVTATLGSIATGGTATVRIYVTVNGDAPHGQSIVNTAYVNADNFPHPEASQPITITVGYPRCLPLLMKRYPAPYW